MYHTAELQALVLPRPGEYARNINTRMLMLRLTNYDICQLLKMKRTAVAQRKRVPTRRGLRWWSVILAIPESVLASTAEEVALFPVPPPHYLQRLKEARLIGQNPTWEKLAEVAWDGYLQED